MSSQLDNWLEISSDMCFIKTSLFWIYSVFLETSEIEIDHISTLVSLLSKSVYEYNGL